MVHIELLILPTGWSQAYSRVVGIPGTLCLFLDTRGELQAFVSHIFPICSMSN